MSGCYKVISFQPCLVGGSWRRLCGSAVPADRRRGWAHRRACIWEEATLVMHTAPRICVMSQKASQLISQDDVITFNFVTIQQ